MSDDDKDISEHLVHIKVILGAIAGLLLAIEWKYFG
jgi:hypothetical protein